MPSDIQLSGMEVSLVNAMSAKEENRNQPLRKPSVRKKLQQTTDEPKPPTPKKRGLER